MGGRDGTCRLTLQSLLPLLLLWLGSELLTGGTWICKGFDLSPGALPNPLQGSHVHRDRIRNYLNHLASAHVESPVIRTLTYAATDCSETVDSEGRTMVVLQFPGMLRTLVKTLWEFRRAELQVRPVPAGAARGGLSPWHRRQFFKTLLSSRGVKDPLRIPRAAMLPSRVMSKLLQARASTEGDLRQGEVDSTFPSIPGNGLDATAFVQEWMRDCSHPEDAHHLKLQIDPEGLQLRGEHSDICGGLAPRVELKVTLQERRRDRMRPKRTLLGSCDACHRHPIRLNISKFVTGFHPNNAGADGLTELYYCHGSCNNPQSSLIANQWTQIKSMAHLEDRSFPAPYCAAVAWGNLSGIQIQQDNSSFPYNVTGVVVTKCQCL